MVTYTIGTVTGPTGPTCTGPTGPTGYINATDSLSVSNVVFSNVSVDTISMDNLNCSGITTSKSFMGTSATLSGSMTVGGDLTVSGNIYGSSSVSIDISSGSNASFSVPSWAKKITIGLYDVSHSGSSTAQIILRLGSTSGTWTTNYNGQTFGVASSSYGTVAVSAGSYALIVKGAVPASSYVCGTITLVKCGTSSNCERWVCSGNTVVYSSGWNEISSYSVVGTANETCSTVGIYNTSGYTWDNGIVNVQFS